MRSERTTCPTCSSAEVRKHGHDRQGRRRYRCRDCRGRFTGLTGTPCSGYRFPAEIIALAVRWYLRYRLRYADVVALLAARGVPVDPSTVFAWVRAFAPRCEDAARPFRRAVGSSWRIDETDVKVAGAWADVYRAIDGDGQVVDVDVSARRATADAAAFFRRAIAATGVVPTEVATDCAACAGRLLHPSLDPGTLPTRLLENQAGWSKRPAQVAMPAYELVFTLHPEGIFDLPEGKRVVVPTGPGDVYGPSVDTATMNIGLADFG
jgi:transposase-like protein